MDADDEAVLSLIAECEWDLSNPPGGMSSSQKESEASLQTSQGRLLLAERVGTSPARGADVCCLRIHAVFLRNPVHLSSNPMKHYPSSPGQKLVIVIWYI